MPGDGRSTRHQEALDTLRQRLEGQQRREEAFGLRQRAARRNRRLAIPPHPSNGDEDSYPNRIGNHSKMLRHDASTGEVDPDAYDALLLAIARGGAEDFDALASQGFLGCSDPARRRRLVNPQAAYSFDLQGLDSHQIAIRPAPAFASAETAGELVELYWMALLRDVCFDHHEKHPLGERAARDLSRLSDFRGPKRSGEVTPETLFRDAFPGCASGPYLSQFLLQPAPFGAQEIDQRIRTNAAGIDFLTTFGEWLEAQNGWEPTRTLTPAERLFCHSPRDLAQYVHADRVFQAGLVALLVLLAGEYPVDAGNPYGERLDASGGAALRSGTAGSPSQTGLTSFGSAHAASLIAEPATRALKAVWYQKWVVHRRLRPEEFAGRVEVQRLGRASYPFHADLASSSAQDTVLGRFGTQLLPLAFPEGCANHSAYGSAAAAVAGASITMLKAFFDEGSELRNPVVPSADGRSLERFRGPPLSVGGELNKLASNLAQACAFAGLHWRSDGAEGLKLGEEVAIQMLREQRETYSERFSGFRLTRFDGRPADL